MNLRLHGMHCGVQMPVPYRVARVSDLSGDHSRH